jgi:hypothetical protein
MLTAVVSLDFAADDEILLFATVGPFEVPCVVTIVVLTLLEIDRFCVVCPKPAIASAFTKRRLNNAFFITGVITAQSETVFKAVLER